MKLKTAVVCLAALFSAVSSQTASASSFDFSLLNDLSTPQTLTTTDGLASATFSGYWLWDAGINGLVTNNLRIDFIGKPAGNVSFSFDMLGNTDDGSNYVSSSAGGLYPTIDGNLASGSFGSSVLSWISFSGTRYSPIGVTDLQVSAVPEPSAALMFGLGLTALLAARRRKSI